MIRRGLIGGTGAARLLPAAGVKRYAIETPHGNPSSAIAHWRHADSEWLFIARHGEPATIPPHRVNYRANVWALHQAGCTQLLGVNAVGGITESAAPGRLMFADQLIDYTWGRAHTYEDGNAQAVRHVEFTSPVAPAWHARLVGAAARARLDYEAGGVYGVTQGPRLETAAEIERLARDGCDVVGMTAMPEAALARELGLEFAICAVVVNRAAGRGNPADSIHAQIAAHLEHGMGQVVRLLELL